MGRWMRSALLGLPFLLLSLGSGPALASDLTISGDVRFADLDGSPEDADGLANGIFTVNGDLTVVGTISCNDDTPLPSFASACDIAVDVSGNLVMQPGSAIVAENRRGAGNGGAILLRVEGDLTLQGALGTTAGALVSSSRTDSSTGSAARAGAIHFDVGGKALLEAGAMVVATAKESVGGAIEIAGLGRVEIHGLVASGPSTEIAGRRLTDEVLKRGFGRQVGGPIAITSAGSDDPGIRIGTQGIVVSQSEAYGAGRILLEACGIEVTGLVASVSKKGASRVSLRSGRWLRIDGRDLGDAGQTLGRLGRVRADAMDEGTVQQVEVFAQEAIEVWGPPSQLTTVPAVSANRGGGPRSGGGKITVLSLEATLTASGRAFESGDDEEDGRGGTIALEAKGSVLLDGATISAVGDFKNKKGRHHDDRDPSASEVTSSVGRDAAFPPGRPVLLEGRGGTIVVRSYQDDVSWEKGIGDVRPVGKKVSPERRGSITIRYCTTVSLAGSVFPTLGDSIPPFPREIGDCTLKAPHLPAGEPPLASCPTTPIATDDHYDADSGVILTVPAPGVLANDSGTGLVVTAGTKATVQGGSVTLAANGGFSYTPPAGFVSPPADSFDYTISNALGTDTGTVTVTVGCGLLGVTPLTLPDGTMGIGYAQTVAATGGTAPYTFKVTSGALPTGLALNSTTGLISGPPSASGPFTFEITATDAKGCQGMRSYTVTIACGTITVNPPSLGSGLFNTGYSVQFTAAPAGSYTFAITAGAIPPNMTFSDPTLSGAPSNTGLFSFTVTAKDGQGCTGSRAYSLAIAPTAGSDAYEDPGNTQLVVGATPPLTPYASYTGSVLDNDGGPGKTMTATSAVGGIGGAVAMNPNGTFTYTPPVGSTGAATFQYTVTSNGVSSMGGVTITVAKMVWYVNNGGGAGDGRSQSPFATLAAAQAASSANHYVFVHTGAATYAGGITLKTGQSLRGRGADFKITPVAKEFTLAAAGTPPTLAATITGAANVTIAGLNVDASAADGIVLSNVGGVAIDRVTLDGHAASATALAINATNLSGINAISNTTVTRIGSSTGAGQGAVRVVNSSTGGTLTFDADTFSNSLQATSFVFVGQQGASSLAVNVQNSLFTGLFGQALQVNAGDAPGTTGTTTVTVLGSTFKDANVAAGPNAQNGILLSNTASGATLAFTISGNTVENIAHATALAGMVQVQVGNTGGVLNGTINNNVIRNSGTGAGNTGRRGIMVISQPIAGGSARVNLVIDNNDIDRLFDHEGVFVALNENTTLAASNVRVSNNRIGQLGGFVGQVGNTRPAIDLSERVASGASTALTANWSLLNNTVSANTTTRLVRIRAENNNTMNMTISGNTITQLNGGTAAGVVQIDTSAGVPAGSPTLCLALAGNSATGGAGVGYALTQGAGFFRVKGPGTAAVTAADVVGLNTAGSAAVTGTINFNNNASCPTPP